MNSPSNDHYDQRARFDRFYLERLVIASAVTRARASVNSPVMSAPGVVDGVTPARGRVFRYQGFATDPERGLLTCRYSVDGRDFAERVSLSPGPRWDTPAARAAALQRRHWSESDVKALAGGNVLRTLGAATR
jgi:hypothetical protein